MNNTFNLKCLGESEKSLISYDSARDLMHRDKV